MDEYRVVDRALIEIGEVQVLYRGSYEDCKVFMRRTGYHRCDLLNALGRFASFRED